MVGRIHSNHPDPTDHLTAFVFSNTTTADGSLLKTSRQCLPEMSEARLGYPLITTKGFSSDQNYSDTC